MRPFKPYTNLIHFTHRKYYQLNAVIELPSDYSVVDETQAQIDNSWVVTLLVRNMRNMNVLNKEKILSEFTIKLDSPDIGKMDKVICVVKDHAIKNGDTKGDTSIDPDDAEENDNP